jgi:hypothetical protein
MDWNLIFGQLGWSGILAAALVYVFQKYVEAQNLQILLLKDAIAVLQKRADRCEDDRNRLHARLEEVLLKGLTD